MPFCSLPKGQEGKGERGREGREGEERGREGDTPVILIIVNGWLRMLKRNRMNMPIKRERGDRFGTL